MVTHALIFFNFLIQFFFYSIVLLFFKILLQTFVTCLNILFCMAYGFGFSIGNPSSLFCIYHTNILRDPTWINIKHPLHLCLKNKNIYSVYYEQCTYRCTYHQCTYNLYIYVKVFHPNKNLSLNTFSILSVFFFNLPK